MTSTNTKKRSLSFILSVIIALIIVIVFSIFLGIMRTNFVNTSEALYVNQMQNFSNDIARQMADTLETEIQNATLIAKDQRVITAMKTGKYEMARPLLKSFFYEKGIYEQVFMSTMEKNSLILVSANGKADGVRWGNIPEYAENTARAMQGQVHTSNPGKSPVTGLAVIVVTAPIMDGSTPIGIIGLPVDVGLVSKRIVKQIKIGKTGYPFITNYEGLTFAHPDEKNIFKLNLKEYEWGREILAKQSGTVIHYDWEGKGKILTFHKDEKFKFISAATLYKDDYMSDIHRLDLLLFPMAVVLIAVSIIFITVFMRRRLRPLSDCEAVMIGMAEGNLTLRYRGVISNDEIGSMANALNNTLEQFERLISEIISTSKNLSQAVNEISSGNQNLSQRTSEQASSLEEVASTIEEATAAIRQNADNSTEADKLSNNTMKLAEEGNRVVIEAVESINEMSKSSKKIEEIISVINEIAFQTNLLALNAAVEAARAGEQGRGFAVVAGEVRNLAQRSGNAAKEIGNLIKDSLGKITTGTELVNKSGEALSEIVSSMKNMARLISEIAASSQEQKQGIDQINIAISEMDTLTQQNAALVEETAATSEEVASQAKELENMVEKFIVNEYYSDSITAKYIEKKEKHLLTDNKTKKAAKEEPKPDIHAAKKDKADDTETVLKEEGFEEF